MISRERLEELIYKCATVYMARAYIEGIYLMPDNFEVNDKELVFKYKIYAVPIEDLFETKEEAEWHKEFGCIERTERLELPTWEEIENIIDKKKRFGLNHSDRILSRIITKDSIYYFKLCKDIDLFTFQMEQTYIGEDLCEQITSRFPVSLGKATKDNYIKVCRKSKELFLGENK